MEREEQVTEEEKEKSMQKKKRWGIVAAALFLALSMFGLGWIGGYYIVDSRARSLAWMIDTVEDNYYLETDGAGLYDAAYDALEQDRFCTHYTPEEYEKLQLESEGVGEGYGVSLYSENGAVRLYRVAGNSPAEIAGLRRGMYLYTYGAPGGEMKPAAREALTAFLGENGSCVFTCGYTADGSDAVQVEVHRAESYSASHCFYADSEGTFRFRGEDALALTAIASDGAAPLDGETGYIYMDEFDGNAAEEFRACLSFLKSRGRKHLVLDLRGNGGGYLSILCEISANLLRGAEGKSPLVTSVKYRSGKTSEYRADGNDFYEYFSSDSRIRVFADENTASASESLIGAMLDYGTISYQDIYLRAQTGRTFGKGVMQSTFVAPDGNAMRLTVAKIFWPKSGTNIHDRGITCADGAVPVEEQMLPAASDAFFAALG